MLSPGEAYASISTERRTRAGPKSGCPHLRGQSKYVDRVEEGTAQAVLRCQRREEEEEEGQEIPGLSRLFPAAGAGASGLSQELPHLCHGKRDGWCECSLRKLREINLETVGTEPQSRVLHHHTMTAGNSFLWAGAPCCRGH